jgi:hypothetical protein
VILAQTDSGTGGQDDIGNDNRVHHAIDIMFFVPAYPFWALTIIAVDVVALYGLCAYGSHANLDLAA